MGQLKRMDQIKMIIRTYVATNKNIKATTRRTQISRNTVRHYIRLASAHYEDVSDCLSLSDEEFGKLFYPSDNQKITNSRVLHFEENVDSYLQELKKVGVTRHLLWEEYRQDYPDGYPKGYGYTQFCKHLNRHIERKDLTILLQHKAGEKLQLDFAGKGLYITDASSGEQTKCEVLVGVMPHSGYTCAVALPSQKVGDFIKGINTIFKQLGSLPQVVLSDNLKSFVTKSNRYEPTFNEACVQLATHYQIDLEATRVAKPKDKGSVENGVTQVYRQLYAPLRHEVFFSIQALNKTLKVQLEKLNHKPFQKKSGTRAEIFLSHEKPVMRILPTDIFQLKRTISAKVQRTYHIMLGEEKNYYSVPFQYVGQQATVIYTSETVEIYIDNQRVAIHERLPGKQTYKHKTNPDHLPKKHEEWLKTQGYTAQYFYEQAEKIGTATRWAIAQIMVGKIHEASSYKSCEGTLRLAKHYSASRLEAACQRCQEVGTVNFKMLENILKKNLDQESTAAEQLELNFTPPVHDNIRGPAQYT